MIRPRLAAAACAISALFCLPTIGLWILAGLGGGHSFSTGPRGRVGFDSEGLWLKSDATVTKDQIAATVKQFIAETGWRAADFEFDVIQTRRAGTEYSGYKAEVLDYRTQATFNGGSSGIPWTSSPLGQQRSIVISFGWPLTLSLLFPWLAMLWLLRGKALAAGDGCQACGSQLIGYLRIRCPDCRRIQFARSAFALAFALTLALCAAAVTLLALPLWLDLVGWMPVILAVVYVAGSAPHVGNRCSKCFYNLTGNSSGVCPECGTPIQKEPADESPRPV